jgi:hypothetical protein
MFINPGIDALNTASELGFLLLALRGWSGETHTECQPSEQRSRHAELENMYVVGAGPILHTTFKFSGTTDIYFFFFLIQRLKFKRILTHLRYQGVIFESPRLAGNI